MIIDREKNAARDKELNNQALAIQDSWDSLNQAIYGLRKPANEFTDKDRKTAQQITPRKWDLLTAEIKSIDERLEFLNGDRLAERKDDHEQAVANLPVVEKRIVDGLLNLGYSRWIGEPIRGSMIPGHWLSHNDHIVAREKIQDALAAISHLEGHVKLLEQQRDKKLSELEKIKLQLIA